MGILENLIGELRSVCADLEDRRVGPEEGRGYSMADIGLSAFSLFFMGSPSFLAHQRALKEGHGRSNCETLFGLSDIPSDNYIRLMLDGTDPARFDGVFFKALEKIVTADALAPLRWHLFLRLDGRVMIARDGVFPQLSWRRHRCAGPRPSPVAAARVHRLPGRSREAGP